MSSDFHLSTSAPFKLPLEGKGSVAPKKPSECEQKVQTLALQHLESLPSFSAELPEKKVEPELQRVVKNSEDEPTTQSPREGTSEEATAFLFSESPRLEVEHASFETGEDRLEEATSPQSASPVEVKETDEEIVRRVEMPSRSTVLRDMVKRITVVVGPQLGRGTFGQVLLARDPSNHEEEALKLAFSEADTTLANEYRLLRTINPHGEAGIQLPPREFVTLSGERGRPQIGYLAPLYKGDLETIDLTSYEALRSGILQLTSGLLRRKHLMNPSFS